MVIEMIRIFFDWIPAFAGMTSKGMTTKIYVGMTSFELFHYFIV